MTAPTVGPKPRPKMDPKEAQRHRARVRRTARAARAYTRDRDDAIRAWHAGGASIRAIAAACELSPSGVAKIINAPTKEAPT